MAGMLEDRIEPQRFMVNLAIVMLLRGLQSDEQTANKDQQHASARQVACLLIYKAQIF